MKVLLAFLAALAISHYACSAELFGTVDAISGSASISDKSGKAGSVSVGQKIYEGQTIGTAADGEVHIVTEDGGIIALRPGTTFRIDEYKAEGDAADRIFMSLVRGAMRSITGWIGKHDTAAYRITTPNATIGIRGTDHETTVIEHAGGDEPGTYDTVNEGATLLKNSQGETEVRPGRFAFVPRNRMAAPFFLARQPGFWARRRLRIEARIERRKEFFRGHMERMREKRIKLLRPKREQRLQRKEHRQAIESRDEPGESRLERLKHRREARHERISE